MYTCKKCGFEGNEDAFLKKYKYDPPRVSNICKECNRLYALDYRRSNREMYNLRAKTKRTARKEWCVEYKGGKCEHCLQSPHFAAFDFHHTDPGEKDMEIGLMMASEINKLKAELDKCILLCSNCHRTHHFKEGTLGEIKSNRQAQKQKAGSCNKK